MCWVFAFFHPFSCYSLIEQLSLWISCWLEFWPKFWPKSKTMTQKLNHFTTSTKIAIPSRKFKELFVEHFLAGDINIPQMPVEFLSLPSPPSPSLCKRGQKNVSGIHWGATSAYRAASLAARCFQSLPGCSCCRRGSIWPPQSRSRRVLWPSRPRVLWCSSTPLLRNDLDVEQSPGKMKTVLH